jgi:hypothetical protein
MPSLSPVKQQQRELDMRRLRDAIFEQAGISLERRLKALNGAYQALERGLEATKTVVIGQEPIQVPDNPTQIRAAQAVMDTEGVVLGKAHEQGGSGQVTININAPWFEPGPTTNSSQAPVVIDADVQVLDKSENEHG